MTKQNRSKIKILFNLMQSHTVVTSSLLESNGISRHLREYYLKNNWIESLGRGAYKKPGEKVSWEEAIEAIQKQTKTKVHVGGLSALVMQGFGHYLRFNNETLFLFSPPKTRLPRWFTTQDWSTKLYHRSASFLPYEKGLMLWETQHNVSLRISSPERAILECLLLVHQEMDLVECYRILEGLTNLRPKLLNNLLKECKSVKVKRLFLYLAEKANHLWFQFLTMENIHLGKGDRMISKAGSYSSKYKISISKELAEL